MKNIFEEICILMQFMTRIPIPVKVEYSEEKLGKSIKYFSFVGLVIGIILYGAGIILKGYINNSLVVALILILLELKMVGLIHLDGLADSFDGLFSYRNKEKMLEIMKDSRIGANGVVVLIIYFLMKTIFLGEIINSGDMRYLLIFPIISRVSTPINAGFGEYARDKGMSNGIIGMNGKRDGIMSIVFCFILVLAIYSLDFLGKFNFNGIIILILSVIFIFYFRNEVYKKIDGITGDTMGASLEMTALLVLMLGVILK